MVILCKVWRLVTKDRLLIQNLDFAYLKIWEATSCSDLIVLLISMVQEGIQINSAGFQTSPSIKDYINRTPNAYVITKFSVIPVITVRR